MDESTIGLLAELNGRGILIKEECMQLFVKGSLPPDLMARLEANHDDLAEAVWRLKGRKRAAAAWERLRADRQAWIEENKRLGKYRGPD
jgi:hypothetical protein